MAQRRYSSDELYDIDEPLYTIEECEERIREIDDARRAIQKRPVSASSAGVGAASYAGRLKELRDERAQWMAERKKAIQWKKARGGYGNAQSALNGPRQVIE